MVYHVGEPHQAASVAMSAEWTACQDDIADLMPAPPVAAGVVAWPGVNNRLLHAARPNVDQPTPGAGDGGGGGHGEPKQIQ